MSEEQSVAPKERVNITYKTVTGDAKKEVELPLKVMVVGDLTQRADTTPVGEREVLSVNKDNFNQVMEGQNLGVDLRVTDTLRGKEHAELDVSLKFKSLKDMEPDAIVQQVPELRRLFEIREALKELKADEAKLAVIKEKLAAVIQDDAKLRELMSLVEGGGA